MKIKPYMFADMIIDSKGGDTMNRQANPLVMFFLGAMLAFVIGVLAILSFSK